MRACAKRNDSAKMRPPQYREQSGGCLRTIMRLVGALVKQQRRRARRYSGIWFVFMSSTSHEPPTFFMVSVT